ncbi:MAG: VWA domain-containing protein [Pseudomonadota bacterium]
MRLTVVVLAGLLGLLLAGVSFSVFGSAPLPVVGEIEPNDKPLQGLAFNAPAILSGAMPSANDQDAYRWQVEDADAQRLWNIALEGMPDALTGVSLIQVTPNAAGTEVAARQNLLTMGIRDGSRPVGKRNLVVPAGQTIVGVFGAGQSHGGFRPPGVSKRIFANSVDDADVAEAHPAYRVRIEPGDALNFVGRVPHARQDTAVTIRHGTHVGAVAVGTTWYRFEIPSAAGLQKRTSIEGGIELGRAFRARLLDSKGIQISQVEADGQGQILLPNLVLPPGTYFLETQDRSKQADTPAVRWIRWQSTGAVLEGEEQEPNAAWAEANVVDLTQPLAAMIDKARENDFFRFELDEQQVSSPQELVLESADLSKVTLCLLNAAGTPRQCRSGAPPLALSGLVLNAGTHGVKVERSNQTGAYSLRLNGLATLERRQEQEPNDQTVDANLFGKRPLLKGSLDEQDTDRFVLVTTGEPQLWRVQAIGEGLKDLNYLPQHGDGYQRVRAGANSRRLRMDNLFLLPGRHLFTLDARRQTSYVIRALPLGAPRPDVEREPNDDRMRAHTLALNSSITALLTETSDVDVYRFFLAAPQAVRLTFKAAPDAQYKTTLYQDGGQIKQFFPPQGEGFTQVLWLEAGDYYFHVGSSRTSEGEYRVVLDQVSEIARRSDKEPNDTVHTASPWPANGHFLGDLGVSRAGADWYVLPRRDVPIILQLTGETVPKMSVVDAQRRKIVGFAVDAEGKQIISIPVGEAAYLYVSGRGRYDFYLRPPDDSPAEVTTTASLQLSLTTAVAAVAAYSAWQQTVPAQVQFYNNGTTPLQLRLQAAVTDNRWQFELAEQALTLKTGAHHLVDAVVTVGADAWPDLPVRLQVHAEDQFGRRVTATTHIAPEREYAHAAPESALPVPAALQGHINVARASGGARWVKTPKKFAPLNDGVLGVGEYFRSKRQSITGPAKDTPVLELAGAQPHAVTGFALHAYGLQDSEARRYAREFAVDLSPNGIDFTTALTARLHAHTREQFFPLQAPVDARFARLRLLSSNSAQEIVLGEWKVLAQDVNGVADNLADPGNGGHVVYIQPALPSYGHATPMLVAKDKSANVRMQRGVDTGWVVGFHHNRAARIDTLRWRNPEQGTPFPSARVAISTTSPLGPWTDLGEWHVDQPIQTLALETPLWARFVRFDVKDGPARAYRMLPDQLEIFESPGSTGSILGEWGHDSAAGPYEVSHPALLPAAGSGRPLHVNRRDALELATHQKVQGKVRLADYENWYRINVPEGHNVLTLNFNAALSLRTKATLLDLAEQPVDLLVTEDSAAARQLMARVLPGTYWLRVQEPPRSVVFTWDTSGSTAKVRPIIRQAVLNYVQDVKPGLDEAHMLPFGGDFLSQRWLDQPYMLQTVFNDYNGAGNSSAAETAIVKSAQVLADRPGQRVIVLITDAATSVDKSLWPTLSEVRPRVIALGISSKGAFSSQPLRERDLMQDWAAAGGGSYEYIENVGALERAFDRASTQIRQAAVYELSVSTQFEDAPAPGLLEVVYSVSDGALRLPPHTVEVVLDASGSMLQRLQGQRRYEVAQSTLTQLVQEKLPDGVQLALRVFGHRDPGTCRTDLVLPPAPLDRKATTSLLSAIVPKNLAKTPIAASLLATAQDLSDVRGEKVILLITDGEETCEGDVEAAIEKIAADGLATTVNIVGFALEDRALEAKFKRWAGLGGGTYRGATDAQTLGQTVAAFSAPDVLVTSIAGEVVARGHVGDPAWSLAPGNYQVSIGGEAQRPARVTSGATTTLDVTH